MSIRVTHGSGSAELESLGLSYADGTTVARYAPQELVRATIQVLRGVGADNYADAIENGLDRDGLVA